MTYIQNLFTSRDNNTQGNAYVGQEGRLWWNPDTNAFYYSDGNTAGGIPVSIDPTSNTTFNVVTANTLTSPAGTLNLTGNINISGNISAATTTKIGGVRAGPGANISDTGLLTIDSSNVPFSFGNFFANNNILSIVNVNEDMILSTDGSAEIQLIGNVGFYKPDGLPPNIANRYASFNDQGQVQIIVTATDGMGAVEIVGTTTGNIIEPGISGTMFHATGQLDIPCRLYYDGNGDYVSWVARRWNGNVDVPTQVLANEDVLRINATAATDAGVGNVAMAQIQFRALQDQTTTAQGSTINFVVTPVGSSAASRVEVANVTVANGFTATKFTTAGTVSATGNITGGNVTTVGITSTGSLTASTTITATGNITGGNLSVTNIAGTLTTAAQPNITSVGTLTSLAVTGNITSGNVSGTTGAFTNVGGTVTTAAQPNITSVGTLTSVSVSGNVQAGNLLTAGLISATGNINGGNVSATNYTGLVTHSIRNAGDVTGTTLTLNVTADDIVKCIFTNNFTVGFSNIIAGRTITLIATNTSAADTDIITTGISSVNMQGDNTLVVAQQSTAVITYYSLDGDVANIYASAVYA
jgi:hypothetical protein